MGKYGKTITDSYQEVLEWTITAHELQEKKKVSKREIDKLEDGNEHGMVALKLAQSFGTPKEVKTVQDINKRHNRAGSIEHKDQKERDAIIRKYYDMAEAYEVDEGKMKDIVTDVKDALGKIRHRVSQKGSKFIVSVDSNDEEDAQKAMKNHPLYVAGKLRVIPEETELGEKKQLKPNAKFDFDLFSDMKGAKEANAELNKELHKAVRMKDKKSAVAHMRKIQNKYMKFGATDTEPSMTIGTVLDAIFENKEIAELKKRIELDEAKFQVNYSKNNKLYSKTINAKDEDDAEEKVIKKFKIDDDDIRSVVKETLDEMFDYVLLDKDNKIVGRYSGKDAKKNAESGKKSAHLPPMRIPKGEVSKMKVYPISPKDKKGIGDMVLAIGEEVNENVNVDDAHYDAQQHSDGSMGVKKVMGKVSLIMKSYHKEKDGQAFAKKHGYKVKNFTKTMSGTRMDLHKESTLHEKIEYVEYKFKNSRDASSAKSYFDGIQLMKFDVNDDNISNGELMVDAGNKDMTKYHKEVMKKFRPKVMVQEMSGKDVAKRMMKIQTMKSFASKVAKMKTVSRDDLEKMLPDYIDGGDITKVLKEKKLTDAEMKKREEIAKAIEKDDPDMPMDKKMAIATATAKRVAEEEEPDKPDTAKKVDQMRDDKKKTRIAQLQLQIAKATETINKLNAQEK